MFVALTDQESGNSTPRCSKFTVPSRQFVITTSRRCQVTSSYGCTPAVVCTRSIVRPWPGRRSPARSVFLPRPGAAAAGRPAVSVMLSLSCGLALGRRATVGVRLCGYGGVGAAVCLWLGEQGCTGTTGGCGGRDARRSAGRRVGVRPVGRPTQIGDLLLE